MALSNSAPGEIRRAMGHISRSLTFRGVSKSFGSTKANTDISFEVAAGSIHAIVGQNGAGKSTLVKIVFGVEQADEGEILVGEERLAVRSPRDALAQGIGLVAQELALIDELSALDNLILGNEPTKGFAVDRAGALVRAHALQQELGFELPWDEKVARLSVPQKQQIEVLRLLMQGADVLIFDEPTAALAPSQIEGFLELLRRLKHEGHTIVFISHKLREVFTISDQISVLRSGKHVGTYNTKQTTPEEISTLMLGEQISDPPAFANQPGAEILAIRDVSFTGADGVQRLRGINTAFREHAITGICGVTGNGQEEFMEVLAGLVTPTQGSITLRGKDVTRGSAKERRTEGFAYVPPDRRSQGLAQTGTIAENAIAGFQHLLTRFAWLSSASIRRHTNSVLETFEVTHGGMDLLVSSLSGGNQQKLMIGREITHQPAVLVASQPTRGVDIGGMRNIHDLLLQERDRGVSVILQSEDLDELLLLSDEISVFFAGEIVKTFQRPFDRKAIGNAMVGLDHA